MSKPRLRMDQVFVLGDPLSNAYFRADFARREHDHVPSELSTMFRLTGYNLLPPPAQVPRLYHGMGRGVPSDIVWPMAVEPPFISSRIVDLLTTGGVTGWNSFPVEIVDKRGDLHPNYHRLMVTAQPCGPINWRMGEPIKRTEPPAGLFFRGGWFDPETWDGSDVFRSVQGGWILVVERVRKLFAHAKIKNVEFVRFTEYEISDLVLRFTPDA